MTRVLVTGGRRLTDHGPIWKALDDIHAETPIEVVIHGMCPTGADAMAGDWALHNQVLVQEYEADWDNLDVPGARIRIGKNGKPYNVLAGFQRNERMLRHSCPTIVLAFPDANCPRGSPGTSDMIARASAAQKRGQALEVHIFRAY
jgi:hypothetical protein